MVAVLVVTMLAGCANVEPTSLATTEQPGPVETTAEPVHLAVPVLKYDIDCPTLIPDGIAAATLGSGGIATRPLERDAISPMSFTVRQVGGLECSWSNDEPEFSGGTTKLNPAHNSVDVRAIPDMEGKFARFSGVHDAAEVQFGEGSSTGCVAVTGLCVVDVEAHGSWLEIRMVGLDLETSATDASALAKATPLVQSIVERIPEPKTPRSTTGTVDCSVALPIDDTLLGLGIPEGTAAHGFGGSGGYEISEASAEYAGAQWCSAGYTEGDGRWAKTDMLPSGAWVFRSREAATSVAYGAEPVSVPGTSTPQSYLACEAGKASCTLDMAVGGDWVRVWLSNRDPRFDVPGTAQDQAELLALASHVLANLS